MKNVINETLTFSPSAGSYSQNRQILNMDYPINNSITTYPDEYGCSDFSHYILNPHLEFLSESIEPRQAVEMAGSCKGDFYCFNLCLHGEMEWDEFISNTRFKLKRNKGIFYHIKDIYEKCIFEPGGKMDSICIIIHPDRLKDILTEMSLSTQLFQQIHTNFKFSYFNFPEGCRIAVKQLLECPYKGLLQNLFIEGKISELLALCLFELGKDKPLSGIEIKLSASDTDCLNELKQILDSCPSHNITIKNLSRIVGLNEYKLKKGFTQMFGVPIHTYLVEKRMNKARTLLENRCTSVSKIAEVVGYSCPSTFSRAFRKRFGYNPSDCF